MRTVGRCKVCEVPMVSEWSWNVRKVRPEGHARHDGHGLCHRHYQRAKVKRSRTNKGTFALGATSTDTSVKACASCERPMVTRRRHQELGGMLDGKPVVRHGSHGFCTGCVDRATRPERVQAAADLPVTNAEVDYRREEWAFLKEQGVTIHEAARRLGVTVRTLEGYEKVAA